MKFIKVAVREVLKMIDPDLEYRMVEQFHFDQLKRKSPELMWKAISPGPEPRMDAGGAQVGHELFVFGGFRWDGSVVNFVDIFDLRKEQWVARVDLPKDMPQTHLGVIGDGKRYIYSISGQLGGFCRPPSADCFVFDTQSRSWDKLVPLPKARYAPVAQLWRGRLHSVGGAEEDRNAPATDHWSIAIENGKALEKTWRSEPPIPRGGQHRASAVLQDHLYVFGGQEGDYIAIPGDPEYRCTAKLTEEVRHPETYRLKAGESKWERMADMAVTSSHTEASVVRTEDRIVIMGGDRERIARKDEIFLNDEIQVYDATTDSWKIAGRLPYRLKEAMAGYYNGYLYITTGQRDRGPDNPTPLNRFERGTWKTKFDLPK